MAMLITAVSQAEDVSSWAGWKLRTELALDADSGRKPFYFLETVSVART